MQNTSKTSISNALGSLRDESYYPLIQFAKDKLGLDIQDELREELMDWAAYLLNHERGNPGLKEQVLSNVNSATQYIMSRIEGFHPKRAKLFFNYIKDTFAKKLFNRYVSNPDHKQKLVNKIVNYGSDALFNSIKENLESENLPLRLQGALLINIKSIIENIDDKEKTLTHLKKLKKLLKDRPEALQKVAGDLLEKNNFSDDLGQIMLSGDDNDLYNRACQQIKARVLRKIKKGQARAIYKYDGLIEHQLPASLRGLHSVDKSVVQNIALKGDKSKDEDLFNFEVASRARYNQDYHVGHTGASNRSSTPLLNVALYFASKHGLSRGKPKSTWIMIYESSKGLNMTEYVDASADWTEFEFATPELTPNKFLGAVKLEVDESQSQGDHVRFNAVDGFVAPKVHQGDFNPAGIEGPTKKLLDMARYYDKPQDYKKPDTGVLLPKDHAKLSKERTLFQKFYDYVGLSPKRSSYLKQRENQVQFVRHESNDERLARIALEKQKLNQDTSLIGMIEAMFHDFSNNWFPSSAGWWSPAAPKTPEGPVKGIVAPPAQPVIKVK